MVIFNNYKKTKNKMVQYSKTAKPPPNQFPPLKQKHPFEYEENSTVIVISKP